jgi:hypothetical protein
MMLMETPSSPQRRQLKDLAYKQAESVTDYVWLLKDKENIGPGILGGNDLEVAPENKVSFWNESQGRQ